MSQLNSQEGFGWELTVTYPILQGNKLDVEVKQCLLIPIGGLKIWKITVVCLLHVI